MNGFIKSSRQFKTILFTDDSTLDASHNNLNALIEKVNNELKYDHKWMSERDLHHFCTKSSQSYKE